MRYGQGSRIFLDHRDPTPCCLSSWLPRPSLFSLNEKDKVALSEDAENIGSSMSTTHHPLDLIVLKNMIESLWTIIILHTFPSLPLTAGK